MATTRPTPNDGIPPWENPDAYDQAVLTFMAKH